jgi:hypothetical protein
MKGLDPTCTVGAFRGMAHIPKLPLALTTPLPLHSLPLHSHLHLTSLPLHTYFTTLHLPSTPHISTLLHAPLPLTYAHLLLDLCILSLELSPLLLYKQGYPSPLLVGVLGRRIPTLYHYFLFED